MQAQNFKPVLSMESNPATFACRRCNAVCAKYACNVSCLNRDFFRLNQNTASSLQDNAELTSTEQQQHKAHTYWLIHKHLAM